ncbi:hypothetical protein LK996_02225 [Lysobacter sp. A6]|uniref:RiboL-PSP-HEPN domain-containing protein n=1 Tax=Noviluteimonas lactosilytica TaxID=2888523 RepID=A0ABS8JE71_9GAMM|nr:hypothetical protein [Lysobacter lactosilyticus]MCC8361901.1 hypothetical protein [Lysobacter lactosilyticus]
MNDITSHDEKAWTGREVAKARRELERDISMALGSTVIAFTRLEFDVAMLLAWQDGGREEEQNSELAAAMYFAARVATLGDLAKRKFGSASSEFERYANWIDEVNGLRKIRNCLVHGRWGFKAMEGTAVNVVGLPAADQMVNDYRPHDLLTFRDNILRASKELHHLTRDIPV